MSRHDPLVTLRQLLDFVVDARTICKGRARSDLGKDRMFTLAMERLLTLIGEAARRLPVELQATEPQVQWRKIISMRNRIMHGYDTVDYDIAWGVLTEELPTLETRLREIISRLEQRR